MLHTDKMQNTKNTSQSEQELIARKTHHTTRKRSTYQANHTAALSLDVSNKTLLTLAADQSAFFNQSKNNILFHAANRIDLFFYILVAYYKTGLTPKKGATYLQYGKGRSLPRNITQANHSSLFASFIDETHAAYPLEHHKKPRCILTNTHFFRSLNATVELPYYVNALDNAIESDCRDAALSIIQAVAKGVYDPIEGLKHLFQLLDHVLEKIKKELKAETLSNAFVELSELSLSLRESVLSSIEQGTFAKKWNKESSYIERCYIELLFRLTPAEKAACKKSKLARDLCYEEKISLLQKEILGDSLFASITDQPSITIQV